MCSDTEQRQQACETETVEKVGLRPLYGGYRRCQAFRGGGGL